VSTQAREWCPKCGRWRKTFVRVVSGVKGRRCSYGHLLRVVL
jgi:hypothetical protein